MTTLLERQIEIITLLLLKDDWCVSDDLVEALSVSNRTIRNDLNQIKLFLKEHNAELKSEPHKGYKIVADIDSRHKILGQLESAKSLSQEEIVKAISILLLSFECTTYNELATFLDISKQTLIKYMDTAEAALLKNEITVNKIKGKGLSIQGREYNIRDYMKQLINVSELSNHIITIAEKSFLTTSSLKIARQIISDIEMNSKVHFYEQRRLELLLSYCLYRISIGKTITDYDIDIKKEILINDSECNLFYKSLRTFPLSDYEKYYLISILLETKVKHLNKKYDNNSDAEQLAKFLMKKLQLLHPFRKQNTEQFLTGLTSHLTVALYRIRNNIPIQNELLEQIKIRIALIYLYTKQQLLSQEDKYDVIFDENEIAYVAMYLASTFETSLQFDMKIKVLIECSFGTTTSAILDSRIRQLITECEIVGPFSTTETKKYLDKEKVDLIITTHEGTNYRYPTLIVNPLLNPEDADYIHARIFQLSYEKMCESFMNSYLKQDDNKSKVVHIKDLISRDDIQIFDKCNSWEEAIHIAASPLLDSGKLEQRYVLTMIDAVRTLGTYMVLLPETAFVHAGTDSGIHEDCCSLLVLKQPIILGDGKGKLVRNIIVLGVKNREKLTLLDLVSIFQEEKNRVLLADKNIDIDSILELHN